MKPVVLRHALLIATVLTAFYYPSAYANNYPFCQLPNSDSDNDGWGWENNSPCLVENSAASNALAQQQTRVSDVVTRNLGNFAVCTTTAADEDGDGW